MGVLRSYPSSNVSTMSHRMSQPGCQGVSSPPPCSRGLSGWRKNTERGKTVGREDGSECVSLPPLSSTSTLSRGVTSYLRPGAVSLAASMARGALSLSLSFLLSFSLSLLLPLAWLDSREDSGVRSSGLRSHGSRRGRARVGDGQRPGESEAEERAAPVQPRL